MHTVNPVILGSLLPSGFSQGKQSPKTAPFSHAGTITSSALKFERSCSLIPEFMDRGRIVIECALHSESEGSGCFLKRPGVQVCFLVHTSLPDVRILKGGIKTF